MKTCGFLPIGLSFIDTAVAFLDSVEEEADCVGTGAKLTKIAFAVDIVALAAVFGDIFIDKFLKHTCGKTVDKEGVLSAVKGKSAFAGPEIKGKKLGVIGLGAIGVMVANAANALGMQVYGYDPFLSVDAAWHLSRAIHKASSLKEIFEQCDYITIHAPLLEETKHMIGGEPWILQIK